MSESNSLEQPAGNLRIIKPPPFAWQCFQDFVAALNREMTGWEE